MNTHSLDKARAALADAIGSVRAAEACIIAARLYALRAGLEDPMLTDLTRMEEEAHRLRTAMREWNQVAHRRLLTFLKESGQ